jgi:hypothetical protein
MGRPSRICDASNYSDLIKPIAMPIDILPVNGIPGFHTASNV